MCLIASPWASNNACGSRCRQQLVDAQRPRLACPAGPERGCVARIAGGRLGRMTGKFRRRDVVRSSTCSRAGTPRAVSAASGCNARETGKPSGMPALHAKVPLLVLAIASQRPGRGCALRLDGEPFDLLTGHARKTFGFLVHAGTR